MSAPTSIRCVNCDGKGYIFEKSFYDGMRRPKKCPGCEGSGTQHVRGVSNVR